MSDPYCDICGVVDDLHNKMYCNLLNKHRKDYILTRLKACKYQEALERTRDCNWPGPHADILSEWEMRAIAKEALEL